MQQCGNSAIRWKTAVSLRGFASLIADQGFCSESY